MDDMLDDLPPHPPQLLPQQRHFQPHQPQPHPPAPTPEAIEADARVTIWHEHGETMKQIRDDVDSLLATLWARDTDPRELRGMFDSLKEEVRRTRTRLAP